MIVSSMKELQFKLKMAWSRLDWKLSVCRYLKCKYGFFWRMKVPKKYRIDAFYDKPWPGEEKCQRWKP